MFVDHSDESFPPILMSLYHSVKALGHPLQDGDGDRVEEVENEAETILREVKQASVPLPGGVGGRGSGVGEQRSASLRMGVTVTSANPPASTNTRSW